VKVRAFGCAMLLFMCRSTWGGTISLDLNFSIGPGTTLRSSASAKYTSIFGLETSEAIQYHHQIMEGEDPLTAESGYSSTPWSNVVSTNHTVSPPHCYRAEAGVAADDSTATKASNQTCYQGPPPPPVEDICDGPTGWGNPCSPVIINLADGPWRLSGIDEPVYFDIDGDGRANRITWTGHGEPLAFLALDRNGNGAIDNGAELFGTATPLASGGVAPNGFDALMELDTNGDGVVDSSDPAWGRLILWRDTDHDGVSGSFEMSAIASSEVAGLGTRYHATGRIDRNGNTFRYMSLLNLNSGETRPYYDVFFRSVP
jgi:hypothetical protein